MKELIAQFSQHLQEASNSIDKAQFDPAPRDIHQVVICGLGGSGIGGSVVAELLSKTCALPIVVVKDYELPAFVGENTLVIACSYSGNTEETLLAVKEAIARGAMISCITSGGTLKKWADEHQFNQLNMPGGNPPRSMFAYSFAYLWYQFQFYGLAQYNTTADLAELISLLDKEEENIRQEAKKIARHIQGRTVQLLAASGNTAVAARWRQQLNENAKMLAWEAEIPEMNHNELVGWEGGDKRFAALFLRNEHDHPRNQKRMEIIRPIIADKTDMVLDVWSMGDTAFQRAAYSIHLGDWVSYYLSELNQVDIIDIKSIDLLKGELAKLPID